MTLANEPALERELKFAVPAGRAEIVLSWLRTLCDPDPAFAEADIWTVYYDGPGWPSLGEKLNSDYLKLKVRLRWYGETGQPPGGPAFLEAKARIGTTRQKRRVRLPMDAAALAGLPLEAPEFAALPKLLASQGVIVPPDWASMVSLKYRRSRFIERASGARIALDCHITPIAVNRRHLSALNMGPLPDAVLEVKGKAEQLPARLAPVINFGARKQAFSKYAAIWSHVRRVRH